MAFFTPEEAAQLAKSTVRLGTLVTFEFASDTQRVWTGDGPLTVDGETYAGLGELGQIDGLREVRNAESHQVTFSLSGISPDLLPLALSETEDVAGQMASVAMQLFDAELQPIGSPIAVYWGIMQAPRVSRTEATETEGAVQTIAIPSENIFVGRHRPRAGRYTDREQQTRYPGDRFCAWVAELV
ncbi:MAG: hypothetical protein AB7U38_15105, partial [Hyphomicrobiales bacterium]